MKKSLCLFSLIVLVLSLMFSDTFVSATPFGTERKILASDAETNDRFGQSVAISGRTLIVGSEANAAYVFNASTQEELYRLTASDATDNAFGISVAISSETAIVGAIFDDAAGRDAGAAYLV